MDGILELLATIMHGTLHLLLSIGKCPCGGILMELVKYCGQFYYFMVSLVHESIFCKH